MPTFSLWDISNCNCVAACWPCALPFGTNLTVTVTDPGTGNGSGILTYGGVGSGTWTTACIALSGGLWWVRMQITCAPVANPTCTFYQMAWSPNSVCVGASGAHGGHIDHPLHCNGFPTATFTLVSFTCSPLNIVFADPFTATITITP
jgi:hypothetical protein